MRPLKWQVKSSKVCHLVTSQGVHSSLSIFAQKYLRKCKDTYFILQNKYLHIYEDTFGAKILRDYCVLSTNACIFLYTDTTRRSKRQFPHKTILLPHCGCGSGWQHQYQLFCLIEQLTVSYIIISLLLYFSRGERDRDSKSLCQIFWRLMILSNVCLSNTQQKLGKIRFSFCSFQSTKNLVTTDKSFETFICLGN